VFLDQSSFVSRAQLTEVFSFSRGLAFAGYMKTFIRPENLTILEFSECEEVRDEMMQSTVMAEIAIKFGNHHPDFYTDPTSFVFYYSHLKQRGVALLQEKGLGVVRVGKRFIHIPVLMEITLKNQEAVQLEILNQISQFANAMGLDIVVETCKGD